MNKIFLLAALTLLPASALAAPSSYLASKDLVVASSTAGNSYLAGGSVTVSGQTAGDLTALGGTIVLGAPITGDALLIGGIESVREAVAGDVRAIGGRVSIDAPVAGDEVIVAGSLTDSTGAMKSAFILAGSAALSGGAKGPVTIYGNTVSLGGNFQGDVTVVASGRVTLAEGTVIHGTLDYKAPEAAVIPASAVIGKVHYTSASYLPSNSQTRALAFVATAVFLLVKILGALILAGLLAGLFPRLAEAIAETAFDESSRRAVLITLLGFGILIAGPVLLILLALTFIGLGLAFLLGVLYVLLAALAFIYAGITVGALLARTIAKRTSILWRDAVFGMLALMVVSTIPIVGGPVLLIIMAYAEGALARLFYHFAFPKDETKPLL